MAGDEVDAARGSALDAALDELFAVEPAAFVATRARLAKGLRTRGHADAARRLQAARRPTRSARALNVLARREPELLGELFDRSEELRTAQAEAAAGSPGAQRAAMRAQRQALSAATDAAVALVEGSGESVRPEIRSTLQAAAADSGLGDAVRRGRLERCEVAATGFPDDPAPDGTVVPADELVARRSRRAESEASRSRRPDAGPGGSRAEARRREREEQQAEALRAAIDAVMGAEEALETATTDAVAATARLAELEQRVEALRAELDAARLELREAKDRVPATTRALKRRRDDLARRRAEVARARGT